jgi:hypothetical protein
VCRNRTIEHADGASGLPRPTAGPVYLFGLELAAPVEEVESEGGFKSIPRMVAASIAIATSKSP